MRLTAYLFDETVAEFNDAILTAKLEGDDPFTEVALANGLPFDAKAYIQRDHATQPKWLRFYAPYLPPEAVQNLSNVHNSIIVLVRVRGRILAVCQGYAHTAINRDRLEFGFGLKTTLNTVDAEAIKCCDACNVDTVTVHRRSLISREGRICDLGINVDEDLLRFVSGHPSSTDIGTLIQGSDSLSWTADFDFNELGARCEGILDLYSQDTYRQSFPFIDKLKEVKHQDTIEKLEASLREALVLRDRSKLTLACPTLERWDDIHGYLICQGRNRIEAAEMDVDALSEFAATHPHVKLDPDEISVLPTDDEGKAVSARHKLRDYVVFETTIDDITYVFSLRKWYVVAHDYVREVDDAVRSIPRPADLHLPPIGQGVHEAEYNKYCAASIPGLLLLDRNLLTLSNAGRVEACDLLSHSGQFIHVKRGSRSATLSHLFAQGSVSFHLLQHSAEYRRKVLAQLPPTGWALPFDEDGISARDGLTCVYVVTAKRATSIVDALPFFSKVNLKRHKESMEAMGFRVAACVVPIVADAAA